MTPPDLKQLRAHYNALRKTLSSISGHWPEIEVGGVEIDSTVATSTEELSNKLIQALTPPADGAATSWNGWWQTTASVQSGEWPGPQDVDAPAPFKLLDAEWVCTGGASSVQVRHAGGHWRVTTLGETTTPSGNTTPLALCCDVTTQARAGGSLTHRVYIRWDDQRAQMAPYAARLCGMQVPEGRAAGGA